MNVIYTDRVRDSGAEFAHVQQATNQLEAVAGKTTAPLTIEWDRTEDEAGRPALAVRLRDAAGEARRQFPATDLSSPTETQLHLHILLGEFLQARNERHVARLAELGRRVRRSKSSGGPSPRRKRRSPRGATFGVPRGPDAGVRDGW